MLEADPQVARCRVQHDVPDRAGRDPVQVSKGEPWIPYEVHSSPHDLAGYDEPLFPVADTPIGRLGCAICYDWLFPEAMRQLAANGAEVLIRVSAYMDPWGATEPMNWWTVINRARAIENIAYVVASNQGASLRAVPAVLVAGRIADRRLRRPRCSRRRRPARASASSSRRSTSPRLRHERESRRGHHMLAHLRTEAYPVYRQPQFARARGEPTVDGNNERIAFAKTTFSDRSNARQPAAPATRGGI